MMEFKGLQKRLILYKIERLNLPVEALFYVNKVCLKVTNYNLKINLA